jgi:outer membrane protein assembly factor BamB
MLGIGCGLLLSGSVHGENWPGFRGAQGGGVSESQGYPTKWSEDEGIQWKTSIPGVGHASPIVWGDHIFLTTAIAKDPKAETFKKGLYFGGNQNKADDSEYVWAVLCLDRETGSILWQQTANEGKPRRPRHIKNSYASETPVTDGKYVFAYFGTEGLACFDFDGNLLWKKDLGDWKMANKWGTASSPVLYKDSVIVQNDNDDQSYIAAFEKATGKELWRTEREEKSSWATPTVFETESGDELVTNASGAVRSYDPKTGKLKWEIGEKSSSIAIPVPVMAHGLMYITSGYVMDKTRPIVAIKPGASGQLNVRGEEKSDHVAWFEPQGGSYNPSPVVYGDYMYVLYDRGFMSCYEAKTGKPVYDKERFGRGGQEFTASPVASGGKLYCLSEDGVMFVVQAGPEFKILEKNSIDEVCMATPALVDGKIYLRAFKHLYCIDGK